MSDHISIISIEACCEHYKITTAFIRSLHDRGLLQFTDDDSIAHDDLGLLEKYINFHYNMDINMEGIEAIAHLLEQMETMRRQMVQMQNRLAYYE
jgi:hypothetical protein